MIQLLILETKDVITRGAQRQENGELLGEDWMR
jgi:hypothetical protein